MRNRIFSGGLAGLALALLLIAGGCGDDDPTEPVVVQPQNLPVIPVPTSVNDLMPVQTGELVIGMSGALAVFEPRVSAIEQRRDDGAYEWLGRDQHLVLACQENLPRCTCDAGATECGYLGARPRLLHSRYWRRLEQNTLSPGTSYTLTKEVTYGVSSTHTESTEFSRTLGVDVTVGGSWNAFSASVTASYEETSTWSEVNSVTITEEVTESRQFTVEAPLTGARVYVLWQLVDKFAYVDADTVPIHQSATLQHVQIPEIACIEIPSENVFRMKTTDFD